MTRFRILAAGALAVTLAGAGPALADNDRGRNAVIGAGVGAIAGAMLGDGDPAYIAGGALAGATVGYAATRDDRRYYRGGRYYRDGRYWRSPDEWRRYNQRYNHRHHVRHPPRYDHRRDYRRQYRHHRRW